MIWSRRGLQMGDVGRKSLAKLQGGSRSAGAGEASSQDKGAPEVEKEAFPVGIEVHG